MRSISGLHCDREVRKCSVSQVKFLKKYKVYRQYERPKMRISTWRGRNHWDASANPYAIPVYRNRIGRSFALRNIHRSIKVYQISRRAMSLVSGLRPVQMRPLRPLTGEILLQQFTESFTIIGDDAPGLVRTLPCRQKLRQVFFQFITATRQKLIKKFFRPVRPVNLIGVVKEIMGISCSTTCRILELPSKAHSKRPR